MTEQTFITDIINTNKTDYLSAIRVLLTRNYLKDDFLGIVTLLESYNLPETNQLNIISRFVNNETFDISSYEG
jgi:hypothetical protein